MTTMQIFMMVFDGFLVAILAGLRALSLVPTRISSFELHRRLQDGDSTAQQLQTQHTVLPRLQALRRLVEALLCVLLVLVTVQLFGGFLGAIVAIALIVVTDMIARQKLLRTFIAKQYGAYETRIVGIVARWKWLNLFVLSDNQIEDVSIASKPELVDLIDRAKDVLTQDERQRLMSSLSFGDVIVKDIMTPRSMIDSLDQRESIGPLVLDQLHKTGHSRFPVIDGDIDHVVGMLYLHDLVTLTSTHRTAKGAMQSTVYYVREDHDLEHALHAFLRTHHHLFIVVNEFRETVGLLSLEDVIESLLGYQVIDEFDEYHDIRKVAASNPRKSNQPKGRIDI